MRLTLALALLVLPGGPADPVVTAPPGYRCTSIKFAERTDSTFYQVTCVRLVPSTATRP